jgi:GDPmannose 4,6-dehydratase
VDIPYLCGDSTKVRKLGWQPRVTFEELVQMMVMADMESLGKG